MASQVSIADGAVQRVADSLVDEVRFGRPVGMRGLAEDCGHVRDEPRSCQSDVSEHDERRDGTNRIATAGTLWQTGERLRTPADAICASWK
jgi:hypothetical protein